MRVPLEWLREYVRTDLPATELAERLALTGTEVERVEHHGVGALENFVVGRVISAEPHPDADRLRVCSVDIGSGEPSQIVCGAPNVAAGQTVAVARPGSVMPDGTKLKRAKLRGQESNGMILAEDELAIGSDHAGIIVLAEGEPAEAHLQPGAPLSGVLPLATDVLVLEITPNRPDCLGIYGVAREVHAATAAELLAAPWAEDPGSEGALEGGDEVAAVTVECRDLCPRFTARVFENVAVGPSPAWLKARLMAAGQRPISNVVDITNYVMLAAGQPLHAFDLDRVAGRRLTVRRADAGEEVRTLDGQTRTLNPDIVLIADEQGPTSIAGVMGGERSEVHPGTTRVLMEAATWLGANIHRTSLALGLRSEASGRFEKGLQPEQALEAQALATKLMVELCGATVRGGTIDIGGPAPAPERIRLRDARVAALLGAPVERRRAAQLLEALEFTTVDMPDGLEVTVPPFRRADVTREADLIEEVARLDGLENLPATLPSRRGAAGRLTVVQRLRRAASDSLAAQGLNEVVGWSFVSPDLVQRLELGEEHPRRWAVRIENPLSNDLSLLRTTLIGGLLDVAARNRAHGQSALRLFEAGAVYLPTEGDGDGRRDGDHGAGAGGGGRSRAPREPYTVAALLCGDARPAGWRGGSSASLGGGGSAPRITADFFTAKAILQGMLERLRIPWRVEPLSPGAEPFLHPGRAAAVLAGGERVGWLGEIHPQMAGRWELEQTVAAFELDLDAAGAHAQPVPLYRDLAGFPDVREDLAVVVGEAVAAEQVLETVRRAGRPLLAGVQLFDRYVDRDRLGAGNVSLALRLSFRASDRTLTDDEVAARRGAIIQALGEQLGGRVRDA